MTGSQPSSDFAGVKEKQRAAWSSGDYSVIGATIQIVGETLCEAVDLRSGSRVLDVAAGNGNATLAAARRWCEVVSTDYVPHLLDRGRARAEAEGHSNITFQTADAEALPFPDADFDAVLSTFGVMFTPDQEQAARELWRVLKPGGRIGLASWTPDGFVGRMFQLVSQYTPLPVGINSPSLWGTRARMEELFPAAEIRTEERQFVFRYRSPSHWLDVFRVYYGPMHRIFSALDTHKHAALSHDLLGLVEECNRSGDSTLVLPADYLEVVIDKPRAS